MHDNITYAFLLTAAAGLSTGIGSTIAFFAHKTSKKLLSFALGVSAGVMIYVSFVELLHVAQISLTDELGDMKGKLYSALAFFSGMLMAVLIDKMVPHKENPHEIRSVENMDGHHTPKAKSKIMRMGLITAIALAAHNFPEGIATFITAIEDPSLGIAIAIAIAIHNIPEGIAVAVPVFYATGNRKKAFWYSFMSGLSEPVGAVVGYFVLLPFITPVVMSCMLAGVAGIMVFISVDELLPAAREYGEHHISIYGLVVGMVVMAASLILAAM